MQRILAKSLGVCNPATFVLIHISDERSEQLGSGGIVLWLARDPLEVEENVRFVLPLLLFLPVFPVTRNDSMPRAKMNTSAKLRMALTKNPNAKIADLATKHKCSTALVAQIRKSIASNGAPKKAKKKAKPKSLTQQFNTIEIDGVEFNGAQLMVLARRMQ